MHRSELEAYGKGILRSLGLPYRPSAHESIHPAEAEIDMAPTGPFYPQDAYHAFHKAATGLKAKHGSRGSYTITHLAAAPDVYGHWEASVTWIGRRGE